MVEKDLFITYGKAKATIVAGKGVSVSQQLVRMVQKRLGYSCKKGFYFKHGPFPSKSQLQLSWNVAIRIQQRDVELFFSVDETFTR